MSSAAAWYKIIETYVRDIWLFVKINANDHRSLLQITQYVNRVRNSLVFSDSSSNPLCPYFFIFLTASRPLQVSYIPFWKESAIAQLVLFRVLLLFQAARLAMASLLMAVTKLAGEILVNNLV